MNCVLQAEFTLCCNYQHDFVQSLKHFSSGSDEKSAGLPESTRLREKIIIKIKKKIPLLLRTFSVNVVILPIQVQVPNFINNSFVSNSLSMHKPVLLGN